MVRLSSLDFVCRIKCDKMASVKGLYTYQASGPGELDVEEGAMYELSSGAGGGQHYADGWWEGYDSTGKKGIFPSNYVSTSASQFRLFLGLRVVSRRSNWFDRKRLTTGSRLY